MTDARKPRRCQVILLDERRLEFAIQPKLMACDLLDMVASQFNLHEKEYFGLSYTDESNNQNWLRMDKKVVDHDIPRFQDPLMLNFSVRFFVPNILILREPITVELFFMQAKILIFKGTIQSDSETVFELAGYALQAANGDFTTDENARRDIKKMAILPTRTLKEHPSISYCEDKVLSYYKSSAGQSRGETIVRYLCIFQSLPTYGVHYYEVKDKSSIPWWLGFSPKGIGVYDHGDKIKPRKLFQWNQIENIYFRDRKVSLEIRDSYRYESMEFRSRSSSIGRKSQSSGNMMVHSWYACTAIAAKTMWTMAISQHQFYLDKKKVEATAAATRTLRDVARELTASAMSIQTSEASDSLSSEYSQSISTLDGGEENVATTATATPAKAAEIREMAISLLARKEALMDKLKEKTEELQELCIQEAELIGKYPQETPYIVGKPLPPIRKRVGTSFEFSDLVVSGGHEGVEDIMKQQMQVEIQSKITTAAKKLSEDQNVSKNVRKTRKLSYQKSLKKLKGMEDELKRLKREYLIMDDDEDEEDEDASSDSLVNGEPYHPHLYMSPNSIRRYRAGPTGRLIRKTSATSDSVHSEPGFALVNGAFHGSYPRLKCPPSPSSHSYQGFLDSPSRSEPRSPRRFFDNSRQGPAFQYSDSDTRSDSSTKHSSISSTYTNSEDLIDGIDTLRLQDSGERSPPYIRPMASSWDNHLDDRVSRSPSPHSPTYRYGHSSESLCSDNYSPSDKRAFSFGSALLRPPQRYKGKYVNTSDLGIVTNNGNAGSYSLSHSQAMARSGPNLAERSSYGSSSLLLPMDKRARAISSSLVNPAMAYRSNGLLQNGSPSSMPSFYEEHVLQWNNDEEQQATLV